ncbi:leucine-rich repeat-containing protein 46 isoform X4 [Mixophyes fleayi]|uniref:leucine-rich repeat-containing protein 46 isoform X4 n=1 Tax=Mixophyes fleayi TaxID=3061075 RepID=UPI003F4DF408
MLPEVKVTLEVAHRIMGAGRILATERRGEVVSIVCIIHHQNMAGGDKEDRLVPGSVLAAIVRRNLHPSLPWDTQEASSQALLRLRTVRLDREGITALRDLEMVNQTQSLYLQKNQIKKIENLDVLKNLRFLILSGNRIEEIQNLLCLQKLQLLDLSHNVIHRLDTGKLPQTILILDLTGNPCTKIQDYRQQVLGALPILQELDGEAVREAVIQGSLSDSEEEDGSDSDDTSIPCDHSGLSSMSQDILCRSYQRRNRAMREHEERLAELSDTTDEQHLALSQKDSCNAELPDFTTISPQGANPQHSTSCKSKTHNSVISTKDAQTNALIEQKSREHRNVGTSVSASKPITKKQLVASPTQSGAGRSALRLNNTSARKMPSSDPLPKLQQTNKPSSGKRGGTASAALNERQAISAPSARKLLPVPTKKTVQPLATHSTTSSSSSAQKERPTVSAPSSKKLQTGPPKNLQTPDNPPPTLNSTQK